MSFSKEKEFLLKIQSSNNKKLKSRKVLDKLLTYGVDDEFIDQDLTLNDVKGISQAFKENLNNIKLSTCSEQDNLFFEITNCQKKDLNYKAFISLKPNSYDKFLSPFIKLLTSLENNSSVKIYYQYNNISLVVSLSTAKEVHLINEYLNNEKLKIHLQNPILFCQQLSNLSYLETTDDEHKYFIPLANLLTNYLNQNKENIKLGLLDFYFQVKRMEKENKTNEFSNQAIENVLSSLEKVINQHQIKEKIKEK